MNANQLADILEVFPNMNVVKAATMLRQQQAEIEALKELYVPQANEGDFKTVSRKELLDYIEWLREANTKELTDEEIADCKKQAQKEFESMITPQSIEIQLQILDRLFANAILRKAQEK